MNKASRDCAAEFRKNPAYRRIMEQFLRKYKSYGRPAGMICLPDATPEEYEAVYRVSGKAPPSPLRIQTARFEADLQETPFRGAVLKEVLECYFGTAIETKRERQDRLDAQLLRLIGRAKASVRGGTCLRWLEELAAGRGEGYQLIRKNAGDDLAAVETALLQACQSADRLECRAGERLRLAVLSADATSDPHALDGSTLCGKIFLHLLAAQRNLPYPAAAEDRAALYYECGILCDSIASAVTQVGVRLYTEEGEHPAFRIFRLRGEIGTLTLTNLAGMTAADSPSGQAYLVENQMVFSQLCDHAARFHSPLVCTSGQPAVAALQLLDLLAAGGTELYYSGDFDGRGLAIAAQLLARYPGQLHLWHMAAEDYARCISNVKLTDASLAHLRICTETELAPTAEAVRRRGRDGYQELLLPQLLADLIETRSALQAHSPAGPYPVPGARPARLGPRRLHGRQHP